ncbi:hypothetical protein [Halorhodospira halophila]|uniref:hypothetical protein n=1 Tax=Halorhodospira halophila TaxID=1053 RepID=UPI001650CADD|nr:hypothetical protein [Halorhodospira halophila]
MEESIETRTHLDDKINDLVFLGLTYDEIMVDIRAYCRENGMDVSIPILER